MLLEFHPHGFNRKEKNMKKILALLALVASTSFAGPFAPTNEMEIGFDSSFSQSDFRAVIIGDSQTTSSNHTRITPHYHRWDGPFVGEFLGTSNHTSGNSVNCISTPFMSYRAVDPDNGWSDGGAGDFFCVTGREWEVNGDVPSNGALIGRFRVNLGASNTNAPWSYNWTAGEDLVFRIAVRSGPNSVPAIAIRPDRGSLGSSQVFEISSNPGIQIFEIDVPASLGSDSTFVGGSILFPSGYVEEDGQLLQILGAYVGIAGDPDGLVIGYQGDGGWNVARHLNVLSQDSRVALIEMMDLNTAIMILGHNRETDSPSMFPSRVLELIDLWDAAFNTANSPDPEWILVEPWLIQENGNWDAYGDMVRETHSILSRIRQNTTHVRYGTIFGDLRPDQFDPSRYTLDAPFVHPLDGETAGNLMSDLEYLIFGN